MFKVYANSDYCHKFETKLEAKLFAKEQIKEHVHMNWLYRPRRSSNKAGPCVSPHVPKSMMRSVYNETSKHGADWMHFMIVHGGGCQ